MILHHVNSYTASCWIALCHIIIHLTSFDYIVLYYTIKPWKTKPSRGVIKLRLFFEFYWSCVDLNLEPWKDLNQTVSKKMPLDCVNDRWGAALGECMPHHSSVRGVKSISLSSLSQSLKQQDNFTDNHGFWLLRFSTYLLHFTFISRDIFNFDLCQWGWWRLNAGLYLFGFRLVALIWGMLEIWGVFSSHSSSSDMAHASPHFRTSPPGSASSWTRRCAMDLHSMGCRTTPSLWLIVPRAFPIRCTPLLNCRDLSTMEFQKQLLSTCLPVS